MKKFKNKNELYDYLKMSKATAYRKAKNLDIVLELEMDETDLKRLKADFQKPKINSAKTQHNKKTTTQSIINFEELFLQERAKNEQLQNELLKISSDLANLMKADKVLAIEQQPQKKKRWWHRRTN